MLQVGIDAVDIIEGNASLDQTPYGIVMALLKREWRSRRNDSVVVSSPIRTEPQFLGITSGLPVILPEPAKGVSHQRSFLV